jgi:hypothetical protein
LVAKSSNYLAQLEEEAGVDLSGLREARGASEDLLAKLRSSCSAIPFDNSAALVVVGSLGRHEVTSGSDVDFVLVANEDLPADVELQSRRAAALDEVKGILVGLGLAPPNPDGPLGEVVHIKQLTSLINKDPESNKTLTNRMLLLLESESIQNEQHRSTAVAEIRDTYLATDSLKDGHPPRFLLNDIIRYWRTLAVDYEGKMREREMQGWALRNAKLRTVRKMLFASGLLPLLACHELQADAMPSFLAQRLELPAAERVAASFLANGAARIGGDGLLAYSEFLSRLDDEAWRTELAALPYEKRAESAAWSEAKAFGERFESALTRLLFDTPLAESTRAYSIF